MQIKPRSKGGVYYVHFTDAEGNRQRLSTGTRDEKEAQLRALDLMRDHLYGDLPADAKAQLGGLETVSIMLRRAWQQRWSGLRSSQSTKHRIAKMHREIGHWPREQITADRLRTKFDSLTTGKKDPKPLTAATKNRYMSLLSTAYEVAREGDSSIQTPKLPHWPENNVRERYLSDDEEARVLAWFDQHAAPADTAKQYLRHVFVVLTDTGMRCNEALQVMTLGSLRRLGNGRTGVHLPHGSTKNGKGRVVPLTERALTSVRAMLTNPLHGTWTSQNAGRQWRTVARACGISDVNLHILRHTCASRLIQSGVSLYEVSIWLGHSSMEVTKRYAHLAPDTLNMAASALENRDTGADVPVRRDGNPGSLAHPAQSGTVARTNLKVIK